MHLVANADPNQVHEVTVEIHPEQPDRQSVAFRLSYFEARCRSMKAGVCNAFWLYDPLDPPAKYREGSFSEEIDIFETYGFLWTPTEMKWFVDGREVFARDNDYYHTALYIMFDCEVMQDWVGLPDPADLPSTFSIDYLRVWRSPAQPFPNATGL